MSNLGDLFPSVFKEAHYSNKINFGAALLVEMPEFNIDYPKYAIFLADDSTQKDKCGIVVVNSEINESINFTPYLKSQHVLIDVERHQFLKYDSYIDCTAIHPKIKSQLAKYIMTYPGKLVGNVDPAIMSDVVDLLVNSKKIDKRTKVRYSLID